MSGDPMDIDTLLVAAGSIAVANGSNGASVDQNLSQAISNLSSPKSQQDLISSHPTIPAPTDTPSVQAPPPTLSRLVLLGGIPKHQLVGTQLRQLSQLGNMDTLHLSEVEKFDELAFVLKPYHYLTIIFEYEDGVGEIIAKIIDFIEKKPSFIAGFQEIGYHIRFDDKKWSEYLDSDKSLYFNFLSALSKYGEKVYHVSVINKYHPDTIYLTEKEDLTKLGEEIQDDIKHWPNLKIFDYGDNCIRFLPGVKFPESLEILNLDGSLCIETLNGFKLPNNLKLLIASNNSITSIDGLKFPSGLETLSLTGNKLYFLNYVELPNNLKTLDLSHNRIENTRGIDFPRNLELLSLAFNPIDNIKGLKFPESLRYLDVSCIPNDSMTGIKFPDLLVSLNLQESMTNTRGLKLPNYVKHLNLGNNGVNSVNPLKLPSSIETLYLGNNNIKTLNKVQFPMSLKSLYLGNNLITTLKNVIFPSGLEVLDLEMDPNAEDNDKRIGNLKDVILPQNLRVLKLGYQGIKLLENFEFPLGLEELDLSYNDLKLIKNIKFHNNLKILDLSGNQELIEIDQFLIPESVTELRIPSQLIPNLPGYIIERANSKELTITKSLPF